MDTRKRTLSFSWTADNISFSSLPFPFGHLCEGGTVWGPQRDRGVSEICVRGSFRRRTLTLASREDEDGWMDPWSQATQRLIWTEEHHRHLLWWSWQRSAKFLATVNVEVITSAFVPSIGGSAFLHHINYIYATWTAVVRSPKAVPNQLCLSCLLPGCSRWAMSTMRTSYLKSILPYRLYTIPFSECHLFAVYYLGTRIVVQSFGKLITMLLSVLVLEIRPLPRACWGQITRFEEIGACGKLKIVRLVDSSPKVSVLHSWMDGTLSTDP